MKLFSLKSFLIFVVSSTLSFLSSTSNAQTYTKLNVKGRVQIEIPDDWTINDAEHRKRIKELSESLTGIQALHVAALSAQSFPIPSKIFVRVSFISLEPPISISDLNSEISRNRQGVLREFENEWNSQAPAMWAALEKNGVTQVGKSAISIENLGGKTAMVIRYARTSRGKSSEVVKVAQYHVILGREKALITLSVVDDDQANWRIHDRLKNSILIN
jgi:hypothetical protein